MNSKKALFVCYGGGHGKMCLPVARKLEEDFQITTHTLALTTSFSLFSQSSLEFSNYSNYLGNNSKAIKYGEMLVQAHHSPDSGIPREESIAYLGLSFLDLVLKYGEERAFHKFSSEGRHAFCQNSVLSKVIESIRPDVVVTTNSPRSERAAIEEAKRKGIPNLSMTDLFGRLHFYPLQSDHVTVLCKETIDNLKKEGVNSNFHITGNPAFDGLLRFHDISKMESRLRLGLGLAKRVVLFCDMPAFWDVDRNLLHKRTEEEIIRDLESVFYVCKKLDFIFVIRAHPSQNKELYEKWIREKNHESLFLDKGFKLEDLLNSVDVVIGYTSTVLLEAAIIGTEVIQLNFMSSKSDMPLADIGAAYEVKDLKLLENVVGMVLELSKTKEEILSRNCKLFKMTPATPVIAQLISEII